MKELLNEGNVVILGAGMKVYAQIPEMFVYENTKLSSELTSHEVLVGYVFNNSDDIEHDVEESTNDIVNAIAEAFDRQRIPLSDLKEVYAFVKTQIPVIPNKTFVLPIGEYLVIKTEFTGGSHGGHDNYPDGHLVTCKKLDVDGKYVEDGVEVTFYQSGSFTAMIMPEELEVVRDMKITRTVTTIVK